MRYPIAIEPGDATHAFGVVVPDLPGCFSAGDTLDEAVDNAKEAMELWLETVIDDGGAVPEPRSITEHRADPEFSGWVWAVVTIDLGRVNTNRQDVMFDAKSWVCKSPNLNSIKLPTACQCSEAMSA